MLVANVNNFRCGGGFLTVNFSRNDSSALSQSGSSRGLDEVK